jgi:hypothetical protein
LTSQERDKGLANAFSRGQKIQQKLMVGTITRKTKGKAKKRPKVVQPTSTKERKELVPLMVGSYLTHNPSNLACMQIVRSNNDRRFKTSISHQCNLFLYNKS